MKNNRQEKEKFVEKDEVAVDRYSADTFGIFQSKIIKKKHNTDHSVLHKHREIK